MDNQMDGQKIFHSIGLCPLLGSLPRYRLITTGIQHKAGQGFLATGCIHVFNRLCGFIGVGGRIELGKVGN